MGKGAKQPKQNLRHWPANAVELWPTEKIKPYPRNARLHSDEQIELIANSMQRYGVTAPLLVDEDGVLIYGHGRLRAALKLGYGELPVSVARDWSEEDKSAYRIMDNQIALRSEWDMPLLTAELGDLSLSDFDLPLLGFEQAQLASFGIGVLETDFPVMTAADRPHFQQMTFTLHDSQVETVKSAIGAAKAAGDFISQNENSNGNALARICEAYGQGDSHSPDKPQRRKRDSQATALQREDSAE